MLGPELERLGIELHLTAGHSPEENGVSERGNRSVITKACALMLQAGLPAQFWYLACAVAVFLLNRCITLALPEGKTPFEVWHFRKPTISHLQVFGCQAFRLIRKELRQSEFSAVSSEGILVGFVQDNFNYLIYDLKDKKLHLTHHATFNENHFPFQSISDDCVEITDNDSRTRGFYFDEDNEDTLINNDNNEPAEPLSDPSLLATPHESTSVPDRTTEVVTETDQPLLITRRSERTKKLPPVNYKGCSAVFELVDPDSFIYPQLLDCLPPQCFSSISDFEIPKSFKKAMNSINSHHWKEACDKEMNSLIKKEVWELVDRL